MTQKQVGEDTDHGRKQKYYFSKFYNFWGKDKLLREINKEEWYKFTDSI